MQRDPSLISHMVCVDVKHHVYLLTYMQRDRRQKRRGNQQQKVYWNLEAESIISRGESTGVRVCVCVCVGGGMGGGGGGGCVVEDSRRDKTKQSAWCTFIAESVYLVLNSLQDWEPVRRLKQRSDVVGFTFFQYEGWAAQFCMRRRLWTKEAGRPESRKLQSGVEAWQNDSCLTVASVYIYIWKILLDRTSSTEQVEPELDLEF